MCCIFNWKSRGQVLLFDFTLAYSREINFTPTATGLAIASTGTIQLIVLFFQPDF